LIELDFLMGQSLHKGKTEETELEIKSLKKDLEHTI
jgi:hypothetical protein